MKKRIPAAVLSLALCAGLAVPAAALETEQARGLLDTFYIEPLPAAAVQASTLEDLLAALNDPYTVYYTAEEYADFLESVHGESLVGIGVSIQNAFVNGFELLSILPGSPALEAGLKAGDTVIAVDGVKLTAQDNIAGLLSGEEGTEVTVTVRRATGDLADFTMIRRTVQIPIITYEKRGGTVYFDCSSFGNGVGDTVSIPLTIMEKDVNVWVMDLRSNPGGVAVSAAVTASQFIGGNNMVYYRDGQGGYSVTRTNPNIPDLTNKPLIIQTSPSSASAAELFSGAIRDYGAGIAVGQRTYGKGIAQIVFDQSTHPELFQGDAMKLTAYQFFSPGGATCHLIGVLPSLLVAEEDVDAVTALLASRAPVRAQGWLKLELAGHAFYLDPQTCHDDPATLARLLEALPPAAQLYLGRDARQWDPISPAEVAQKKTLDWQPRTFADTQGHIFQREIDTLAIYGLLSGNGSGNFLPDAQLTRAELCVMLTRAFQLPPADALNTFPDVSSDAWYADAVSAMTARGFLAGTDQGKFLPDAPVTNQELYAILASISAWASMEGHEESLAGLSAPQWLEFYAYPEWARDYAADLAQLGLNVDKENPSAAITRGQAARTIYELMDAMGLFWY